MTHRNDNSINILNKNIALKYTSIIFISDISKLFQIVVRSLIIFNARHVRGFRKVKIGCTVALYSVQLAVVGC